MKKFSLAFAALAALTFSSFACAGETDWPQKSIEFVVPFSAGGDTDFNARCLAKYLNAELGKSVIITNITGGGSSIAMDEVHNSDADGYRYLVNHAPIHTSRAFGVSDYGFEEFETVCVFGLGTGEFITVRSDFPANNLAEFVEYTKQHPGEVKFGFNTGATSHYTAVQLGMAGADMNLVSTGSAADRVVGLKGGHLDAVIAAMPVIADYIKTGEFKVLANCSSQRYPTYPDIPTCIEQGFNFSFDITYTLFTVKGTDAAIIEKMANAVKKIVTSNEEYAAEIKLAYNQVPVFHNTKEATEMMEKQQAAYLAIEEELQSNF